MSYNTRRTGSGFAPSPNAVGQRRPPSAAQNQPPQQGQNYQPQLSAQNKPPAAQQNTQSQPPQTSTQRPQQSNANAGYRTQPVAQQPPQVSQPPPPQTQAQALAQGPAQQQQPPQQMQQKTIVQTVTLKKEEPAPQPMEADPPAETDGAPQKRRPVWLTKANKLSKKERQRRRNLKFSRFLQPKNALMILNELVKGPTFTISELTEPVADCMYEASVLVDEAEMKGYGKNKHAAKSAAAEAALRHIVKYKKMNEVKVEDTTNSNNGQESMEVTEEDVNAPIPWQHIASFALYKLFNSWGDDPDKTRSEGIPKIPDARPNKPLPANAVEVNPISLLNQMQPSAQYEEIGKSGNPPNVLFTLKCTVSGETFIGTGPSKKWAKKMAAYAACHKIYGIQYPPEVYPA